MRHFALSAVGRDRPGIVAAVTEVLLARGVSIEDSEMAILRGHFAMMLILAAPMDVDASALASDLERVRSELDLEALSLGEVTELEPASAVPSHIVTVYGADHVGIVHAVASALARRGVNITDLTSRVVGDPGQPLYVLVVEVALPPEVDAAELQALLEDVGRTEQVEVSVRVLEHDEL